MQVRHLDHLNLSVRNFDETRDWYRRVFDFELVEEGIRSGQRWGVLKSGEALLCIYEEPGREFLNGDELERKQIHGINHFSFRITDKERWEERVRREKVPVQYGGAYPYPHSTSWYVTDPTGYEIEVVLWNDNQVRFG